MDLLCAESAGFASDETVVDGAVVVVDGVETVVELPVVLLLVGG